MPASRKILTILLSLLPFLSGMAQRQDSIAFYLQQYDYLEAIERMDRADPSGTNPVIMLLKANALTGLNRYQQALPILQRLVQVDSTDNRYLIGLAACYSSLGNYRKAGKYYAMALAHDRENLYLVQQLGDALFQGRQYRQALSWYRRAFLERRTFYLSRQMARSFESLDMADSAILYYKNALGFNPSDYLSTYRLANLLKEAEDYDPAILITHHYLAGDSLNVEMLKLNGILYFLDKRYSISRDRFERCLALGDSSEFVNKYLGYSYFKTKNFDAAKTYLEKAFFADTLNADLCYVLGLSCDYSYYKKLSIEYLNRAIDLIIPKPEYLSRVYQDLGKACTGHYQYEEALEAYKKAYELTPGDTLLIFQLGSHYDNWIKDPDSALVYYEKFMETRPGNRKALPVIPGPVGITVSYYDYVERRIREIREEIFWEGKEPEQDH